MPTTLSDERLIALVGEGHERAFDALVARYYAPLLRYCRRFPLPEAGIEEVIQQTFLNTWIALRNGAEVRELKGWLYRVARNTALNAVRDASYDRARVANLPAQRHEASEMGMERRLAAREVLAKVAALPPLEREAIVRAAVVGQSHEQVARELGISRGAVRALVYRARITLRAALTALTPAPLLTRIAGAASEAPASERLAQLTAGGLGGTLVKGGLGAICACTLITGAVVLGNHVTARHHHRRQSSQGAKVAALAPARGQSTESSRAVIRSTAPRITRRVHAGGDARGAYPSGGSSSPRASFRVDEGAQHQASRHTRSSTPRGEHTPQAPQTSAQGGQPVARYRAELQTATSATTQTSGSGSTPTSGTSSGQSTTPAAPPPSGGTETGQSPPPSGQGSSESHGSEKSGSGSSGSSASQSGGLVGGVVKTAEKVVEHTVEGVGGVLEHLLP